MDPKEAIGVLLRHRDESPGRVVEDAIDAVLAEVDGYWESLRQQVRCTADQRERAEAAESKLEQAQRELDDWRNGRQFGTFQEDLNCERGRRLDAESKLAAVVGALDRIQAEAIHCEATCTPGESSWASYRNMIAVIRSERARAEAGPKYPEHSPECELTKTAWRGGLTAGFSCTCGAEAAEAGGGESHEQF